MEESGSQEHISSKNFADPQISALFWQVMFEPIGFVVTNLQLFVVLQKIKKRFFLNNYWGQHTIFMSLYSRIFGPFKFKTKIKCVEWLDHDKIR